jgi:hypothetical protein
MVLVKAILKSDDGVPAIEFMFNPAELAFEGMVETAENPGARTEDTGQPKVSFANVKAYTVTINQVLFDTYEQETDVVKRYIEPFRRAVQFAQGKQRPPIYTFIWGQQVHLRRCFVEKLSYKLTMFLPDGTPVRAVIDNLTLKEADDPKPNGSLAAQAPSTSDRQQDSIQNRR